MKAKMTKEKINVVFEFDHCPHCGMDGTLRLFQAVGKPNRISCIFCYQPIYDIEIIETYFDVNNMKGSFLKRALKLEEEEKIKKEMEELKELTSKMSKQKENSKEKLNEISQ